MTPSDDEAYTAYVAARMQWIRSVAYLLCQDWHRADDLGQTTITKLYVHWRRVSSVGNVDGYVRTILVNSFLSEQRSPWWKRVVPQRESLEAAAAPQNIEAVLDLRAALTLLAPRQRAVVVLRYYNDLSVAETAEVMRCSEGTVKSQTFRALATLRRVLSDSPPDLPSATHKPPEPPRMPRPPEPSSEPPSALRPDPRSNAAGSAGSACAARRALARSEGTRS